MVHFNNNLLRSVHTNQQGEAHIDEERVSADEEQLAPVVVSIPIPQPKGGSSPQTVCSICKGAGYLRVDVPFGHPQFGNPIPCSCKKAERSEKRRQLLYRLSDLQAFCDKRFDRFNIHAPGVQEAYKEARKFARHPDGWLVLIGVFGCGKTHLAAAVTNECLDNEMSVLFTTSPDLLDHLRKTFAPSSPIAYDALFACMREAELLVIDDLGTENHSPWAGEKLFQLLNHRYNWRLPTLITSNDIGLKNVDPRIRSRLSDTSLVRQVTMDCAVDYRPFTTASTS